MSSATLPLALIAVAAGFATIASLIALSERARRYFEESDR